MLALKALYDALDRAFDAEGFAAFGAAERLLFLDDERGGLEGREIEARLQRHDLFGAGAGAEAALDAEAFVEGEARTVLRVAERVRRAGGDAGEAERATLGTHVDATEG